MPERSDDPPRPPFRPVLPPFRGPVRTKRAGELPAAPGLSEPKIPAPFSVPTASSPVRAAAGDGPGAALVDELAVADPIVAPDGDLPLIDAFLRPDDGAPIPGRPEDARDAADALPAVDVLEDGASLATYDATLARSADDPGGAVEDGAGAPILGDTEAVPSTEYSPSAAALPVSPGTTTDDPAHLLTDSHEVNTVSSRSLDSSGVMPQVASEVVPEPLPADRCAPSAANWPEDMWVAGGEEQTTGQLRDHGAGGSPSILAGQFEEDAAVVGTIGQARNRADPVADALTSVAERIRRGELVTSGYEEGMSDAAALAAALAALLGVRS